MTYGTRVICNNQFLGRKACPKQWRKCASKWRKPAEKWRKFSEKIRPVIFVCIEGQEDCERSHWSPDSFFSIEIGCPRKALKNSISTSLRDQHELLTTTVKTQNYIFHTWWRFWSGNYVFLLKISPLQKFRIVGFSRYLFSWIFPNMWRLRFRRTYDPWWLQFSGTSCFFSSLCLFTWFSKGQVL